MLININNMSSLGFIILRHVIDEKTSKYWKLSYESVRKFHPDNQIIIIDDNSNYDFIDINYETGLVKTKIIKSEFPGRAEVLPYYYFIKNKLFDTAVIIHDSVFINALFDFSVKNYKILWSFKDCWDNKPHQIKIIKGLDNYTDLLDYHNNHRLKWKGCFGAMSIINHNFLLFLHKKYNFTNLLRDITCRKDRMCFERIIACMFHLHDPYVNNILLCEIHSYCKWGLTLKEYKKFKKILPIIKVWTGR
jgi:hypothetical protein